MHYYIVYTYKELSHRSRLCSPVTYVIQQQTLVQYVVTLDNKLFKNRLKYYLYHQCL